MGHGFPGGEGSVEGEVAPVKPPRLRAGDTVAFPAAGLVPHRFRRGLEALERMGLRPRVMPNTTRILGHNAGTRDERAADLNDAFRDPQVRAVRSAIGGWTSNSLLARPPALRQGEPAAGIFGDRPAGRLHPAPQWTQEELDWASTAPEHNRPRVTEPSGGWRAVRPGQARGRLVGGHLATLHLLAGTQCWPSFDGAILFWEGCDAPLAEVERYLWALGNLGVYDAIAGMAVGRPARVEGDVAALAAEVTAGYSFPIAGDLDLGHTSPMLTLPIGCAASLRVGEAGDADVELALLEPAVAAG